MGFVGMDIMTKMPNPGPPCAAAADSWACAPQGHSVGF